MVTIDALDKFVHTLSGNVFHIDFDRCGNGRLSVYADTRERILCHNAKDSANTRVFSVPLTGDAFDFDHDDYLLEKYCRLSNPAWVADLQALADQINDAIPGCSVPAIYRIM